MSGGLLNTVSLADVQPRRLRWLWERRIPEGKITIIDGDPGLGKSTLTMQIAADVSQGRPLPGQAEPMPPAHVLIVSSEDDLEDTIAPRLIAAGADLERVTCLRSVGKDERTLKLPQDVNKMKEHAEANDTRLIIMDPLMAYLGGDAHKDQDIRKALEPIARMTQDTGAAFLIVRHLNKRTGVAAVYRGGGSVGIGAAARSVMLVGKHPANPSWRVLCSVKGNLSGEVPSLAFRLVTQDGVGRIHWEGTCNLTADQVLASSEAMPERPERNAATKLLQEMLADGPRPKSEIVEEARRMKIATRTLDRAGSDLGVLSTRDGRNAVWTLPYDCGDRGERDAMAP